MKIENKYIGIFGLARTGIATYEYLINTNKIICFDDSTENRSKFAAQFGRSILIDIEDEAWTKLDYIILSPGVPLYFPVPHRIVSIANKHSIKLISDIELLYLANPENHYIAVTGTNGKSTTTALIGHILSEDYVVAGNIGMPALSVEKKSRYVLELSSYQLDLIDSFRPNIAVLLNISQDHIDRHGSLEGYISAKKRIFKNMTSKDSLVIGVDNEITREIYHAIKNEAKFQIHPISIKDNIGHVPYNIYLQGDHNLENIMASIKVAHILGYKEEEIFTKIQNFIGLKHRMEFIRNYKNIDFYNDSKATNADSASKSLGALENIYWLAGGVPKEGGIEPLVHLFSKIKKAYLFGESKELFAQTLKNNNIECELYENLESALISSFNDATNDDGKKVNILLAPAAASLDQFKNFEERGEIFTNLVLNLQ